MWGMYSTLAVHTPGLPHLKMDPEEAEGEYGERVVQHYQLHRHHALLGHHSLREVINQELDILTRVEPLLNSVSGWAVEGESLPTTHRVVLLRHVFASRLVPETKEEKSAHRLYKTLQHRVQMKQKRRIKQVLYRLLQKNLRKELDELDWTSPDLDLPFKHLQRAIPQLLHDNHQPLTLQYLLDLLG